MMFTPLGSMVDGWIPGSPVGDTAAVMGGLAFGLLVLTTLVILLAGRRRSS
jgi:hypothetical protein